AHCLPHQLRQVSVRKRDALACHFQNTKGMIHLYTHDFRITSETLLIPVAVAEHDARGKADQLINDSLAAQVAQMKQHIDAALTQESNGSPGHFMSPMRIGQNSDALNIPCNRYAGPANP